MITVSLKKARSSNKWTCLTDTEKKLKAAREYVSCYTPIVYCCTVLGHVTDCTVLGHSTSCAVLGYQLCYFKQLSLLWLLTVI